jgi:hypothetical protein
MKYNIKIAVIGLKTIESARNIPALGFSIYLKVSSNKNKIKKLVCTYAIVLFVAGSKIIITKMNR